LGIRKIEKQKSIFAKPEIAKIGRIGRAVMLFPA
jgi:hypothetical protein